MITTRPDARAFSLVEVLIAVLVLALGLLGLGAVFPAVISEQRRAFDSITGESVAGLVQDKLSRSSEVVDLSPLTDPRLGQVGPGQGGGPGGPQGDSAGRPGLINAPLLYDHLWVMDPFARIDGGADTVWTQGSPVPGAADFGDLQEGVWRSDSNTNDLTKVLPITARLHPAPTSGVDPRFVWDPVVRRAPDGSVQVGVFVRRVDDRLAVPRGNTLSDVLTGQNGAARRLPLALTPSTGRLTTDTGAGSVYPVPQSLGAYVDDRQLSWLILEASSTDPDLDSSIGFARRVGQKLLDNSGVVRTVVGIPQPAASEDLANLAERAVIVDPPFTRAEASNGQRVNPTDASLQGRTRRASWVRQVVFTPHIPVAVRVFTLDKE
jgi:hypothetical protein